MKKVLLLIPAFLLAFQISKAQTEKGSQTLGVNVSFHSQKSSNVINDPNSGSSYNLNSKSSSFGIGPSYSYFIANKLDIGVNLGYDHMSNTNSQGSSPYRSRQYDYSAQLFLRKYFMYTDKIGLRAGPYVGYGKYNTKNTYSDPNQASDTYKSDNYSAGANLALVYYPSRNIGISASLANIAYQHSKGNDESPNNYSTNTFDASFISSNVGLSLFYVFGAK